MRPFPAGSADAEPARTCPVMVADDATLRTRNSCLPFVHLGPPCAEPGDCRSVGTKATRIVAMALDSGQAVHRRLTGWRTHAAVVDGMANRRRHFSPGPQAGMVCGGVRIAAAGLSAHGARRSANVSVDRIAGYAGAGCGWPDPMRPPALRSHDGFFLTDPGRAAFITSYSP